MACPGVMRSVSHWYRQAPQGLGTPLGAFRGGNPLERLVAISDK
jgi:hypothetical protein